MKVCSICNSLMEETDRLCPFCGNLNRHSTAAHRTSLLLAVDVVLFVLGLVSVPTISSTIGLIMVLTTLGAALPLVPIWLIQRKKEDVLRTKGNLLLKTQALSRRIVAELEKIAAIDSLLNNIHQPQIRSKVLDAKTRIERLVDSLIGCKVNFDFLRFRNDYSIIDHANRTGTLQPERLSQLLDREDDMLADWKTDLERQLDRPATWKAYEAKLELVKRLKERISLGMVSNILSSTTLLNEESSSWDVQPSEMDIEEEVGRINYEIDRLNAEVELDKLHP